MTILHVIFCERRGNWADAFRMELARQTLRQDLTTSSHLGSGSNLASSPGPGRRLLESDTPNFRIRETRSWSECWEEIQNQPESLGILESTTTNLLDLASQLVNVRRRAPRARCIVVGTSATEWLAPIVSEAGAWMSVFSIRDINLVWKAAHIHFHSLPKVDVPIRELVWQSIPWQSLSGSREL